MKCIILKISKRSVKGLMVQCTKQGTFCNLRRLNDNQTVAIHKIDIEQGIP